MSKLKSHFVNTVAAAGLATMVGATSAPEAKADDLGRLLDGIQQGLDIYQQFQGGSRRGYDRRDSYDGYYEHPSSRNNVKCYNIPNNGPHGGTHRVCPETGYDSRRPTRRERPELQTCWAIDRNGYTYTYEAYRCGS